MRELSDVINDLVIANRILANEGVVDAYGHVSVRDPRDPGRYLLSRSRSPEFVTHDDILEFSLDGALVGPREGKPYLERFIHGAIYEARPEVNAVVHSHALDVLPFTVSSIPLRPLVHVACDIGHQVPVWDIADHFGETSLLVLHMQHARDLAKYLGDNPAALMRGHGFVAAAKSLGEVVQTSVFLPKNARILIDALRLGGDVKYMSKGEIDAKLSGGATGGSRDQTRAWEYWALRAGCGDLLKKTAKPSR